MKTLNEEMLNEELTRLFFNMHEHDPSTGRYLDSDDYLSWKRDFYALLRNTIEREYPQMLDRKIIGYENEYLILYNRFSFVTYMELLDNLFPGRAPQTWFDQPLKILPGVSCVDMLKDFRHFNSPVIFTTLPSESGEWISLSGMFEDCLNFNQEINIPEGVTNTSNMFDGCHRFNSKVTLPSTLTVASQMFYGCLSFDQPMVIPKSLEWGDEMFAFCAKLNSDIIIEDGCDANLTSMLEGCESFDSNLVIPNTVVDVTRILAGCHKFNQPVNIPKESKFIDGMFCGCKRYDQSTPIPEGVVSAANLLSGCGFFNSLVVIPSTLVNGNEMFDGCALFNQELILPKSLIHYRDIFRDCRSLEKRRKYFNQLRENFKIRTTRSSEYCENFEIDTES